MDDDPFIRELARDLFAGLGCRVIDTYRAAEALAIIGDHPEIELVFADVRMPGEMNGIGLASVLRETRPALKVVLTSGHRPDGIEGIDFLPKPWSQRDLAALLQPSPGSRSRN